MTCFETRHRLNGDVVLASYAKAAPLEDTAAFVLRPAIQRPRKQGASISTPTTTKFLLLLPRSQNMFPWISCQQLEQPPQKATIHLVQQNQNLTPSSHAAV